jgi:hypothetical protein
MMTDVVSLADPSNPHRVDEAQSEPYLFEDIIGELTSSHLEWEVQRG